MWSTEVNGCMRVRDECASGPGPVVTTAASHWEKKDIESEKRKRERDGMNSPPMDFSSRIMREEKSRQRS